MLESQNCVRLLTYHNTAELIYALGTHQGSVPTGSLSEVVQWCVVTDKENYNEKVEA